MALGTSSSRGWCGSVKRCAVKTMWKGGGVGFAAVEAQGSGRRRDTVRDGVLLVRATGAVH